MKSLFNILTIFALSMVVISCNNESTPIRKAVNHTIILDLSDRISKFDTVINSILGCIYELSIAVVSPIKKGATITNNNLSEAHDKINEIRAELEKYRKDYDTEVDEIAEVLVDIESKINNKENIPRLTFKSLIESSSNLSSIGSLVISLGQIIGIIPPTN